MSILIFLLISYILLSITLRPLFVKAGEDGWKALVPGLNFITWCKIIGRPAWWAFLLLLPLVNIFIFAGMCVDMVRSFGGLEFKDSALAVVYAPIAFFMVNKNNDKYVGPTLKLEQEYAEKIKTAQEGDDAYALKKLEKNNPYTKSASREWAEAIIFAVFAAAFIRMFLIEAYVIPTPSMEGSLLVGDFLFVSKAHYGIRTPMTTAMVPLLHNRLPIINRESYLRSPSLDYYRLPAIENVERNKPVVFNYPEGDSVYVCPGRTWSINDVRYRNVPPQHLRLIKNEFYPLTVRPIDKRDHYIKRCVAVAGDSLEIRDKQIYINGVAAKNPAGMQFMHRIDSKYMEQASKILTELGNNVAQSSQRAMGLFHITPAQAAELNKKGIECKLLEERKAQPNQLFPNDAKNFGDWTTNNFGPVYIPEAGKTVEINPNNISLYRRVISVYENNELQVKNGQILINGKVATTYTFKQNYYWMMGDNRDASEDSRFWGYVPEDHVVGKPLFIWFSTENGSIFNGIRFNRLFSGATKFD